MHVGLLWLKWGVGSFPHYLLGGLKHLRAVLGSLRKPKIESNNPYHILQVRNQRKCDYVVCF